MLQQTVIELVSAVFGVAGTLLLATRTKWAGLGFIAFLVSNFGWLAFSFSNAHWFMFWQQVAFTVSSIVGIYVWLFRSPKPAQPLEFVTLESLTGPVAVPVAHILWMSPIRMHLTKGKGTADCVEVELVLGKPLIVQGLLHDVVARVTAARRGEVME